MRQKAFFQPYCEQPISVVYRDYELNFPTHYHTAVEAVFVFNGCVSLITENETVKLQKGDIALVPSLVIHGYSSSQESENCTAVFQNEAFMDTENFIPVNASRRIIILRDLPEDTYKLIEDCLGETVYYQNAKDMPMCINHGRILLLRLFRLAVSKLGSSGKIDNMDNSQIKYAQEIIIYVQQHYSEPISLDSVSESLKINKYTISKIINKILGVSLTELVNKYRLLDVCRLLETTSLPLSSIAEQAGFASESTMYRNFQKTFHMSPNEYKKSKPFRVTESEL